MIKQTTRRTIGSMHRADETPGFRKQLADSSGLHLCKVLTSVNTSEMRQIPCVI
jgi:hypothetical protein